MTATHALTREPAIGISDVEFRTIATIAKSISGIDINDAKKSLVVARLLRRLRTLELAGFGAYCAYLDGPQGPEERAQMVSALTTNVTSFYREPHHFNYLAQLLGRTSSHKRPVRLWCAATSTGEEAYCTAMTMIDTLGAAQRDARILATDISPHVIDLARRNLYPIDARSRIDDAIFQRHCTVQPTGREFSFRPPVRNAIRFLQLNLLTSWPMQQKFDAIFCRNVAIYFDNDTKNTLWRRLAQQLTTGGELYLGHSERIDMPERHGLRPFGVTAYRKIAP